VLISLPPKGFKLFLLMTISSHFAVLP
jgi:hypothetical protein